MSPFHPRAMAPTRNSSVTGASSGSRSSLSTGAAAGTGAAPPDAAHDLVEQPLDALGEDLHLLLLQRHGHDLGPGPGLQEEHALARLSHGAGDEPVGRVEGVQLSRHRSSLYRPRAGRATAAGAAADGCVGARAAPPTGDPSAAAATSKSPPVSLMRSTNGRRSVYRTTLTEHGVDLDALERVEVHARARRRVIDLITSPCETIAYVASGAEPRVPVAHRADRAGCHVGHRLAVGTGERPRRSGAACTTFHSGSFEQRLERLPGPVAVAALPDPLVDLERRRAGRGAARIASAVSRVRSSGLVTTAASGSAATRAAIAAACSRPSSSRWTPGVQPASSPVAFASVRPWRTSSTVVTSGP